MKKTMFASTLILAFTASWADAAQTATLSVPGMYCAVCPITVKKALEKVPGVTKATASLEKKEAVVTYDDAKTSVNKLLDATFDAGYPAEVKGAKAK
ncbi:MAG: mercury resistance system periplasmic binding protein MerP [Sulfuricella sp.]